MYQEPGRRAQLGMNRNDEERNIMKKALIAGAAFLAIAGTAGAAEAATVPQMPIGIHPVVTGNLPTWQGSPLIAFIPIHPVAGTPAPPVWRPRFTTTRHHHRHHAARVQRHDDDD